MNRVLTLLCNTAASWLAVTSTRSSRGLGDALLSTKTVFHAGGVDPTEGYVLTVRCKRIGRSTLTFLLTCLASSADARPARPELLPLQESQPAARSAVVWRGPAGRLSVRTLAERLAPILWFSRDEPLLLGGRRIPERLPCDPEEVDGPVVYYAPDPSWAPAETVDIADKARISITFYFYFSNDYGAGCHSNDLERATFRLQIRSPEAEASSTSAELEAALVMVEGAAHGSIFYANRLSLTRPDVLRDVSLPVVLLIEEGKHSVSPDRNGDGTYTPGYDVNVAVNEAWGVRDVFGIGFVGGARYRNGLAKPRWPEDRVGFAGADPMAWQSLYRAPHPFPAKTYALRPVPSSCRVRSWKGTEPKPTPGCGARSLASLMGGAGLDGSRPSPWLKRFSGMKGRVEGNAIGIAVEMPLFEELFSGGVVGFHLAARLAQRENDGDSFGFGAGGDLEAFYTPSLSSFLDWYVRFGYSLDGGGSPRFGGVVGEAGIEMRWFPQITVSIGAVRRKDWSVAVEVGLLHLR